MNIFALSKDPTDAAKQVLDKHVIKMPTETCQMLHTNILYMQYVEECEKEPQLKELKAFHKEIGSELMKPAMLNHPSTIWARQSRDNFKWLFVHGRRLCHEYTWRYNKKHGSQVRIEDVWKYKELLREHSYPAKELTPVTIAMDDKYRIENTFNDEWDFVIESYRHYYLEGKWRIAEWKQDRRPEWFPANHYATKYNVGVRAYNNTNPKYPMTLLEE
jgi:hypothetical protein